MARKYYIENEGNRKATPFWNDNEVLTGYTLIVDHVLLCKLHAKRYNQARMDGVTYFNSFQASLYIDITTGVHTVTEVITLQAYLKNLSDEIVEGSWLTANGTISFLPLSGIFDQTMKDKITLDINTYIAENY
jgi:hypothetical protein